jgi:hypothetical protein
MNDEFLVHHSSFIVHHSSFKSVMNELPLSAEELRIFETFYRRRLAEVAGGAVLDDAEELEIARDILLAVTNDGLTPDADGGVSYVRRGAMDWTDPATLQAVRATTGGGSRAQAGSRGSKSELWQGLLIVIVALLAGVWLLWPSGDGEAEEAEPTDEASSVLEDRGATPTPLPTLEAELLADIVDASGVKTELVVPRTLEVQGVSFVVQPVRIRAGDWPRPDDERAVSWVYGTVINYVLGLEATPDNKTLLASLRSGDELVLRMSTGPAYRFAYADTVRVSPQASEVFRQSRPGLILALLGDEAQSSRVVIRAVYLPESELGLDVAVPNELAALGQQLTLDEAVRLTCLAGEFLAVPSPPGYVYVRVNYRVENIGAQPLLTSSFSHHLRAGGLSHGMVSTDESWRTYPPLPETLPAGQVATTTAIYAIPEAARGQQPLSWTFSAGPTGPTVDVELPLTDSPAGPGVRVVESKRHENGTLQLDVEITAALHPLAVTAAAIRLEGGRLSPVGNHFPWQVSPGRAERFSLLLTPDGSGRLTVALFEQGFEVTY